MEQEIQRLLDEPHGHFVALPPGEYQGPFVIRRPVCVQGNTTTLWAEHGPVLSIQAEGVSVKNLRVELAGEENGIEETAIVSFASDVHFERVEVSGEIQGVADEEGPACIPKVLELGEFYCDRENTFLAEMLFPVETTVKSLAAGVFIEPEKFPPGRQVLTIRVEAVREGIYLYGDLLFCSSCFLRRTYISGKAKKEPVGYQENKRLYFCEGRDLKPEVPRIPLEIEKDICFLKKGQRLLWEYPWEQEIGIAFLCEAKPKDMEIDAYIFLLDKNNQAKEDWRLVFFGNQNSPDGAVCLKEENKCFLFLNKVDTEIERISVAYAIYETDSKKSFGEVIRPTVAVSVAGKQSYAFSAEEASGETTLIFLDFYRYQGRWKVSAVGAGYKDGIKRLCESFGLEVAE